MPKKIEEIELLIKKLSKEKFLKIWNYCFQEETMEDIEDSSREDLTYILLDELEYLDSEKISKITSYIKKSQK